MLLRRNGADHRISANDRNIAAWVADGVTDAQVLQALELAKQRRLATASQQPIGTAYLTPIIAELRNPAPAKPALPPRDDWHRSDAGIDRKGREVGLFARGGESYSAYADRIRQHLAEQVNGAHQ